MYLRTIAVENAGPIPVLRFDLQFQGDHPLPLVLVGRNGSGKSTLLSFIVNASSADFLASPPEADAGMGQGRGAR
jgi:ATPase subunit of ABC transporter with duplicated ATPase domains